MAAFYVGQIDYITQLNILESRIITLPIVIGNSGKFLYTDGNTTSWQTALTITDVNTAVALETTRATTAEALKAPIASPTFTGTVSGITKAMVGLEFAENTLDINKPVSTATTAAIAVANSRALAAEALLAPQTTTYTKTETDTRIQAIVGAAPLALDTLVEIATQLAADETAAAALTNVVSLKAPIASPTFTGTATIPTLNLTNALAVAYGGTGLTTAPANGALDIGNGTGFTRTTLTAGSGISITNAAGSITITATSGGGTVTSVTGTAPVVSSGGATPAISMAAASSTVSGYLTSTDWNTFNSKQPAGSYLTSITSGNVTTALGFTPYSNANPSGYITSAGNAATASAVTFSGITSKPTTLSGYGITNADVSGGNFGGSFNFNTNANLASGTYGFDTGALNGPASVTYSNFLQIKERPDTSAQIVVDFQTGYMYTRGIYITAPTYSAWQTQLSSGNYNSYAPTLTGGGASGNWGINAAALQGLTTGASGSIYTDVNWSYLIQGFTTGGAFGWRATSATGVAFSCTAAGAFSTTTVNGYTPSSTAGVVNRLVATDANGYIFNNYFNSTDNAVTSGVSAIMSKAGDNYYRSASAAAVATFISGQSMNISGNATNVTGTVAVGNGGTGQTTGYKLFDTTFTVSIDANVSRTAGMYGSYAAAATNTPTNSGILYNFMSGTGGAGDGGQLWQDYGSDNLYLRKRWGGGFGGWWPVLSPSNYNSYAPTLTGTGASGTWGISITGNAATITSQANSATITASTAGNANQIVLRDGSGHITGVYGFFNYLNMSHGASGSTTDTIFYSSGDDYIRKNNATGFRASLNVPTRTGGDASGTWNIKSRSLNAVRTSNTDFNSLSIAQDTFTAGTNYIPSGGAYNQPDTGDHHYLSWGSIDGSAWAAQLDIDFYTDRVWFRRQYSSTWQAWRQFIHDGNYNSYAPTLTGTGASGTWAINISGNAANITAYTVNQSVGTANAPTFYGVYSNNWFKSNGSTGWYNETHAVGIYATEAGNVRTYNGASFIAAGNVTAYSDERLKTNWRDMPRDFIERLSLVKNGTYDRTDNCAAKTQDGVSAQSLQPLMPNSIQTDSDGILSIAYGSAAMVSAVELAKRVVEQDARIAKLEALVNKLIKE